MSFGFSLGDFLAVGSLAWNIYRSCKGLSEEFQEVCREALTIHSVIKELQDEAIDPQSLLNVRGAPRKQELITLMKNLEDVLKELDEIVRKYQGLTRRERRIWNHLRLATEDLDAYRSKLTFRVTAINAFTSSLSRGTLVQIETALLELVNEVRQGRREPSLASLHETNNDSVWRELESELATNGILNADVAKHKAAITVFIQSLLSETTADTSSLADIASLMDFDNDDTNSKSLSFATCATDVSSEDRAGFLAVSNSRTGSLVSLDDGEYETADEELPPHKKSPDFNDAISYVRAVKNHRPDTYKVFLDILNCYKAETVDRDGFIYWVSTLFVCSPELLQGFTAFVHCKIECGTVDNRYAFRVITDSSAYVRIPDLQAFNPHNWELGKALNLGQLKWIDPASLNILNPSPTIVAPFRWTIEQPTSRASELQVRKTLTRRFKAFFARSKANKKAATDSSSSDGMNGTTPLSGRLGFRKPLRRPLQPMPPSQAGRLDLAITRSSNVLHDGELS